jgi:hypothetical protein
MKKFLITLAAAAMLLVPAIAEAGGRHGSRHGGNDWIGPLVFGTVLGVIISNSNNHGHVTHRRHHRRHARHGNRYVKVCERVEHVEWDRYGSYIVNSIECRMVPSRRW